MAQTLTGGGVGDHTVTQPDRVDSVLQLCLLSQSEPLWLAVLSPLQDLLSQGEISYGLSQL